MWIGAQIRGIGGRVARAGRRINKLAIVLFDHRHFEAIEAVPFRVGKAVPTPIAENADRHGLLVILGKALQPGDIEVEGELAVADGHGAVGIQLVNDDVVPGD